MQIFSKLQITLNLAQKKAFWCDHAIQCELVSFVENKVASMFESMPLVTEKVSD